MVPPSSAPERRDVSRTASGVTAATRVDGAGARWYALGPISVAVREAGPRDRVPGGAYATDLEDPATVPVHPELFNIPGTEIPIPGYGAMSAIAFLGATWWMMRNARRLKADDDIVLNLAFVALIFSVIGAHTFYVIHYWDEQFAHQPLAALNPLSGGFEFYGGLIGAFIACVAYLWLKGLSIRIYADLVTPSLLFGMGVGRIGCFLHGCCWGGPAPDALPWAVHFPCSSPPYERQWDERLVTLPEELILTDHTGTVFIDATRYAGPVPRHIISLTPGRLDFLEQTLERAAERLRAAQADGDIDRIRRAESRYAQIRVYFDHMAAYGLEPGELQDMVERFDYRSRAVHPAQLYAAAGPLLLAVLTQMLLYRRRRHGMVMVVGFMIYAVQRFMEEVIRSDNPQDTFGLTVSQGVSIGIFFFTLAMYLILQRLPLRSTAPACPPPRRRRKKDDTSPAPA